MKTCETCKWYRERVSVEVGRSDHDVWAGVLYRVLKPDRCTLNPKHIEVTPQHYCGQWEDME